jgi:hypothetical protein
MIIATRVVLLSRSVHRAVAVAVVLWVVAAATGRRSLEIDLSARWPPAKLPVVELCVVLGATLLALVMRPRFWEWDRTSGARRPRVVAAASAVMGIVLPVLCVPAVVPWLPVNTPWMWVLANAVILSSVVHLLAPLSTALVGGGVVLLSWLGLGVVMNVAPGVWVPLSSYQDPEGHWALAAVLSVAAVTIHMRTCGRTAWAQRRHSKEQ